MEPAEQMRIADHPSTDPGPTGFATDDMLAADLDIAARDLRQCANGLRHLEALIPTLARQVETNLELVANVQRRLHRDEK